jgi:hypothetical protein
MNTPVDVFYGSFSYSAPIEISMPTEKGDLQRVKLITHFPGLAPDYGTHDWISAHYPTWMRDTNAHAIDMGLLHCATQLFSERVFKGFGDRFALVSVNKSKQDGVWKLPSDRGTFGTAVA